MKILSFAALFSLLSLCLTIAQGQTLEIGMEQATIEGEQRDAIVILLKTDIKDTKDAWKEYMRKTHDVKVSGFGFLTNKDILIADECVVAAISAHQITIGNEIVEVGEETRMSVFGSHGYDHYFERGSVEFSKMEELTMDFIGEFVPDYLQEAIEDARDVVADLEKDLDKDRDQVGKNEEDILDMKRKISDLIAENRELEKKISQTKLDLTEARRKLQVSRERLDRANRKLEQIAN